MFLVMNLRTHLNCCRGRHEKGEPASVSIVYTWYLVKKKDDTRYFTELFVYSSNSLDRMFGCCM